MILAYQTEDDRGGALQEQLVQSLTVIRELGSPGLFVLHALGAPRVGTVTVTADGTARWADGEPVVLADNTPDWIYSADLLSQIQVKRVGEITATESLRLVDTYNTVAAGPDQEVDTGPRYTAFVLRNDGDISVDLTITTTGDVQVGIEATVMQVIADHSTAPTTVTFDITQAVGALAPDATIGVWLRHPSNAAATAHDLVTVDWNQDNAT